MATGHTHPVIDGEITTVEEFAAECAKSFVSSYRDYGTLTYPKRPSDFYQRKLNESLIELREWDEMGTDERYLEWSEYRDARTAAAKEAERVASENKTRLEKVLAEVENVPVPESHKNFRQFMIDQLTETIWVDGTFNTEYFKVVDSDTWVLKQRSEILKSISYYAKYLNEDEERYLKNFEWVSTLSSLYNIDITESES